MARLLLFRISKGEAEGEAAIFKALPMPRNTPNMCMYYVLPLRMKAFYAPRGSDSYLDERLTVFGLWTPIVCKMTCYLDLFEGFGPLSQLSVIGVRHAFDGEASVPRQFILPGASGDMH